MTPLSKRESDALTSLCNLLIEECVESNRRFLALERALKAHPEIEAQYQKELVAAKPPEPNATLHTGLKKLDDALAGRP
jgi:hypothetical protein